MTQDYIDIWKWCTQKETGFVIPFVIDILVTELPKYLTLVRQDISTQLRTLTSEKIQNILFCCFDFFNLQFHQLIKGAEFFQVLQFHKHNKTGLRILVADAKRTRS